MSANTRFPVAIHILAFAAIYPGQCPSERIAESANTNPVVIRRLNGQLKKAGLLRIRNGAAGTELARPPEEITLKDVYSAVKTKESSHLFSTHQRPNPDRPVGGNILGAIREPLDAAQEAVESTLDKYTIAGVVEIIRKGMKER